MPHKLLLADDSVTIQRVIELTFADEDVQVTAVGNGQAAIDSALRDAPDVILADVGMPERDGYEVAAFIKGNPALAHIPVLLLSGAFEPFDEARAKSAGCVGVLVKPFEPQMVISRVRDLLAGRQPPDMWAASPVAQGPVRPATQTGPAPATAQAAADPLESYFSDLDAAFSTAGSAPPLTFPRPADLESPLSESAPSPPTTAQPLSLADAFTALLAAERGIPPASGAVVPGPPFAPVPRVTDEMIDDITARVLARLSDQSRPAILEVAERLVREEIERIKQSS
jgi:CheY-like chemotaxis protein